MYSPVRWDKFIDTRALFDFGFDEFVPLTVEAEEFAEATVVPVMQDGEEIGSATFELHEPFTALIHAAADPAELRILRTALTYYNIADPATYTISFELPQPLPFVPALLGMVELESYLNLPVVAMFPLEAEPDAAPLWLTALRISIITLSSVMLVLVIFIIHRRRQVAKRRRKRLERFELMLRQAEQNRHATLHRISNNDYYTRSNSHNGRRAR